MMLNELRYMNVVLKSTIQEIVNTNEVTFSKVNS